MRVFTLPLVNVVRGFDDYGPQSLEMTGGVQPMAIIDFGFEAPSGFDVRVQGTLDSVSGVVYFVSGSDSSAQLTSSGAFDETFTLTAAASTVAVRGTTNSTASFSALKVDVDE